MIFLAKAQQCFFFILKALQSCFVLVLMIDKVPIILSSKLGEIVMD